MSPLPFYNDEGVNMTVSLSQLKLMRTYHLSLHAPATLGATRLNATVVGMSAYDKVLHAAAARKHMAIVAELPNGTQRSPASLEYFKIELPNGNSEWLTTAWLNADPQEVEITGLRITIAGAGPADIGVIESLLLSRGFSGVSVEVY